MSEQEPSSCDCNEIMLGYLLIFCGSVSFSIDDELERWDCRVRSISKFSSSYFSLVVGETEKSVASSYFSLSCSSTSLVVYYSSNSNSSSSGDAISDKFDVLDDSEKLDGFVGPSILLGEKMLKLEYLAYKLANIGESFGGGFFAS